MHCPKMVQYMSLPERIVIYFHHSCSDVATSLPFHTFITLCFHALNSLAVNFLSFSFKICMYHILYMHIWLEVT